MLKHPKSDIDFVVSPAYFIGDFNVYDQEETLGVRLGAVDPNNEEQLAAVMDECFFSGGRVAMLSVQHKEELLRVLSSALENKAYDFDVLVKDGWDESFYLPVEWEINDAREFFRRIYGFAQERWG